MKKRVLAVMASLIVIGCSIVWAAKEHEGVESFVQRPSRSQKSPSLNELKEQCADHMADTLRLLPSLMTGMADVQRQVVSQFEDLLEGNKMIAGTPCTKDSLHKMALKQRALNEKITTLIREINQFLAESSN